MKKLLVVTIAIFFACNALYAFGKRETEEIQAENVDSWLEEMDVSGKSSGKYNILVTGEDLAGNKTEAGPYNIYLDPDSDLPVTRITNPLGDMRVPGNLNIVGTAIDDDGIDYVEILLNGEAPFRAEGKEFWSYYLDTTTLAEGAHIISAYSVDIYGVKGRPYTVVWHLDRNRPETKVTNLEMGSLVSGRFTLSGAVTDGNGIKRLSLSLNSGESWEPVALKHDKKLGLWEFETLIDSRAVPDGPAVCWFKAEDLQGSEGIYTFLYFVDNTKPEIGFISPREEESVNGRFSVSGFARDVNGLQSLTWKTGKETGEFVLVKGNPYWVKEFDLTGEQSKTFEVEITAIDMAGNRTDTRKRVLLDPARDVPSLVIDRTPFGDDQRPKIEKGLILSGFASDDDGIKSVMYSLNKGSPVEILTEGSFLLEFSDLPAGAHTLEIWPVDVNALRGPSVLFPFVITGPAPVISIERPVLPASPVDSEAGLALRVSVESPAGITAVSWQAASMSKREERPRSGATRHDFSIAVTPDWPYGSVPVVVTARDIYGRETVQNLIIETVNYAVTRGSAPEFNDDTLSGSVEVTIPASGKTPAQTAVATARFDRLLPDDLTVLHGMNVLLSGPGFPREQRIDRSVVVAIDSPIPVTSVLYSISGGQEQRLTAKKTGETSYEALVPLTALLPARWTTVQARAVFRDLTEIPLSLVLDVTRPVPVAGVNAEEKLVWSSVSRNDSGAILLLDGKEASAMYIAKTDRKPVSVAFGVPEKGLSLSLAGSEIKLSGQADGVYPGVAITITDDQGGTYFSDLVTVIVDSAPPALSLAIPDDPVWVVDTLPIVVETTDGNGVERLEYSLDTGLTWSPLPGKGAKRTVNLDISYRPQGKLELMVRAIDKAGRETLVRRAVNRDSIAPVVATVFPAAGDVVNGETAIGFSVEDDGRLIAAEYLGAAGPVAFDLSSLPNTFVGSVDKPLSDTMRFRFTDAAGNRTITELYNFFIDAKADLPVVEIHIPSENEVIIKDFVVSGVVYDDDAPAVIHYQVDKGPWQSMPVESSFSIPFALSSFTDNEHTITVYAEDIHGVRGESTVRKIRISLEEPKATFLEPHFDKTNRGMVNITGSASDKNGIALVEISLDNGNTFNRAEGTEDWFYRFDSRVIEDGTHVVFIRVHDKYGITGLYSSLINIDNTAPSIRLELPLDGSRTAKTLFISGQTMDNIYLERVTAGISSISPGQPAVPAKYAAMVFENELIISAGIDVSDLKEGFYNIDVRGFDRAGNITRISRNFEIYRGDDRNRIEFLYPMNGERLHGVFNLYGRVISEDPVNTLILFVGDEDKAVAEVSPSGYFMFAVTPEIMTDGEQTLRVRALVEGEKIIESERRVIEYRANGPWVTIDNFTMGDFAIDRPWLEGSTGYSFTEDEVVALRSKDTGREELRRLREKALDRVEISFDNGKTFQPTESGRKWRYRLETGDLREGYHFLIVRSTMKNGEVAVSRSIVQIDKTAPVIRLISPGEGGRYNNELVFSGLGSDDVQLQNVSLALRTGDKSAYAVPSFIQGLYLDWHFWGATLYDIGVGLTFFDDNVKIQAQFGQFTREQRALFTPGGMRYGGNVVGMKMLANLLYLPLDYWMGPDFSWLSATAAIGANFSVFTDTQSGSPQILSALLFQIEFPRVNLPKRDNLRTFSFYTESQVWFIPTDVDVSEVEINSLLPHVTFGARMNIF